MSKRWIEPDVLRELVLAGDIAHGTQPLHDLLVGDELLAVSEPSLQPLNRHTYRVRYQRWLAQEGPAWHGADRFMELVEHPDEPISVVTVLGDATNYVVMLNAERSRVLAALGIDRPDDYVRRDL